MVLFIFNLHLKNVFTLEKKQTKFTNLVMEKPGN